MRDRRVVLDKPHGPDVSGGDRDDVGGRGHGAYGIGGNVFERWVVPVHPHGRAVYRPKHAGESGIDLDVGGEGGAGGGGKRGHRGGTGHDRGVSEEVLAAAVGRGDAGGSGVGVGSTRVLEDHGGTGVVGDAAGAGGEGGVEPVVAHGLVGVDDDVVALADADKDAGCRHGGDGHHVGGDNLEVVVGERKSEGVLDRSVDQAHEVFLPRRERELLVATAGAGGVDILAVEENIVAVGRGARETRDKGVEGIVDACCDGVDGREIPVGNLQSTEVNIVVGRGRAADYDGAEHAVAVLAGKVRVVPSSTVLDCSECVGLALSWGDRTLGHTTSAVHGIGVELAEAVVMNGGPV